MRVCIIIILIGFGLFIAPEATAQCSMCKAVVESSKEATLAEGVNNGILYLMSIPYLLLMGVGVMLFRKAQQNRVAAG
ncbi:MAG: hypothetical protein AAGB22_03915 [Bacteroidota bacterium]